MRTSKNFRTLLFHRNSKSRFIAGTVCPSTMKPAKSLWSWGSWLRRTCTNLLESFNPKATTVDAYFEEAPVLANPLLGEVELKFCHQIFYGCYRYNKLLKLFVTSFVYKAPATALRSEQSLYMILAYLLFFRQGQLAVTCLGRSLNIFVSFCDTSQLMRLDDVGIENLRKFVNCGYGSPPAISSLLHLSFMCCRRCDQVLMILCR